MTKHLDIAKKLNHALSWIGFGVFADQFTKMLAATELTNHPFVIIPHVLRLEVIYNTGMAFGLLADGRILFLIVSVFALLFGWKFYRAYVNKSPWFYWAGILFFAGTLGNFLDRLFYGKVTDFIAVRFGQYQFPIFNVADSFLTLSVVLLLVAICLDAKQEREEK